eukprot:74501-Hanusia_phi.AAC.1
MFLYLPSAPQGTRETEAHHRVISGHNHREERFRGSRVHVVSVCKAMIPGFPGSCPAEVLTPRPY